MTTHCTEVHEWQRASGDAGITLSAYLDRLLLADPIRLGEIARRLGVTALLADDLNLAPSRFDRLPLAEALSARVLPVDYAGTFHLVMADPLERAVRNRLQTRFAFSARPVFAMSVPGVVDRLLEDAESSERVMDDMSVDTASDSLAQVVESISLASIAKDESPIIRLVNVTLYDALQSRASDIHLEATPDGLAIRYRIDGVMQLIRPISGIEVANQTMSRLKVLSSLDIAEKRVPQDGRFKVVLQGREIDFRVSVMPGIHGENIVLRILDKSASGGVTGLDSLGFDTLTASRIRALAQLPYGLTLVTGPTGSGKSTTLYGTLYEINTGDEKIVTIEDPVEYELNGVLQIPVNEKKGLTFSRGLRSILRHDPDTILVGEIRDEETASIAVQSALTGHRVLSSVHANDAFSVIDRFIYMGVEPSTFLEALNGVVSQRLVRRICSYCDSSSISGDEIDAQLSTADLQNAVQPGNGCDKCRGTGFYGRIGLAEVLRLDAPLKTALMERSPEKRMRALAASSGYQSIRDAGLTAVRKRLTTLQEVQRAVAFD